MVTCANFLFGKHSKCVFYKFVNVQWRLRKSVFFFFCLSEINVPMSKSYSKTEVIILHICRLYVNVRSVTRNSDVMIYFKDIFRCKRTNYVVRRMLPISVSSAHIDPVCGYSSKCVHKTQCTDAKNMSFSKNI